MKEKIFKHIVSVIITLQMVLSISPYELQSVIAAEDMYLNEDFSSELGTKWNNIDNVEIRDDETTKYARYRGDVNAKVVSRTLDVTIPSTSAIYMVDFDVRFEDDNSGVVELYGGSNLGPTIIFDGTNIKTKVGNPSTYVNMYEDAKENTWYNIKLLANGTKSMYGYTTEVETATDTKITTGDIKRNLSKSTLTKINLTNTVNSEGTTRPGAVDIRNIKVYKPSPTELHIGVDGDIEKVSVPAPNTNRIVNYIVESTSYNGVDMSQYQPLANGLVKFELYDNENIINLTDNLPKGILFSSTSGALTVSSDAEPNTYNVRLSNYDETEYDSKSITIAPSGNIEKIKFADNVTKLPVPNNGVAQTEFKVQCYDDTNSEVYNPVLKWSVLDADGNELNDAGISIDQNTGVVSTSSSAHSTSIKIKAELLNNPQIFALSNVIPTYKMTATSIVINGADYLQLSNNTVSETYKARIIDQNGKEMPQEEITGWTLDKNDNISIVNGILTVSSDVNDSVVTINVTAGDISVDKKVIIYTPQLSKIIVDGDRSIEIPQEASNSFTYTAKAYDQYDFEMETSDFEWSIHPNSPNGISLNGSTITALNTASEQIITVTASNSNVKGNLRVAATKAQFTYKPIDGGFEIDNGKKNYTRPIYAPHINDNGKSSFRYIYYLGDQPKLVLSNAGTSKFNRYAHMFLGIKNNKWLDEMENITARYVNGHEEYVISDSSFEGTIKLTYTRSDLIDAMLVKAELPDSIKDKLVVATASQCGAAGAQPVGGNSSALEFVASDTAASTATINRNSFNIESNDNPTISGTSNINMNYTVKDASMYSVNIDALLDSRISNQPMVVGTSEGNTENTVYLLITTDSTNNEYFEKYQADAKSIFNNSIDYYKSVTETIKIDTPDPYINAGVATQVMAVDNIWDDPVITHGAIGWHNGQGGWRGAYGLLDAGRYDWIKKNTQHYIERQNEDGRIWAYPTVDGRYNMSLVLVDILMQYWDWTGDSDFFTDTIAGKDEATYNMIAGHLKFMDEYMQVPGTNLYENWLDAWNTDNKWNNGGAGSIATAYTWRAYNTMAQIAEHLNKIEDATKYKTKADAIKKDMNEQLWDSEKGVFGELRERFGLGRLNTAPDLSSIYTPVDMGIATDEQVYQMMRFTDYAVPSLTLPKNFPTDFSNKIDFKYSSNRLPIYYSSDGLYVEEVMNNALAYFENGQREMGMKQFMACLVPLMNGESAGQGTVQHVITSNLTNNGHIDFGDSTAQYGRTVLEGIFGIKMKVPNKSVDIKPGFPKEWEYASIKTNYITYDYRYENKTDIFNISTEKDLIYTMHIPVRSSNIESVKVNGIDTQYTVDNYVNVTTSIGKESTIEVKYGDDDISEVSSNDIGAANSDYTITSNGIITEISDPQGVILNTTELNKKDITVKLADKIGNHTFFVTVRKNDMTAVLPVDLEIKNDIEITDTEIVTGTDLGIKLKLTNNTEKCVKLNALIQTLSGCVKKDNIEIPAKSSCNEIIVPIKSETDFTPGNNKVVAKLSGDVEKIITGEAIDWQIKNTSAHYKTISIDSVVNQDLRTLHSNVYDLTYDGNSHYRLPNFYWSTDAPRTVLSNGRAWWEPNRGTAGVPTKLNLPSEGGTYTSDIGVPFDISSQNGNNAAFVSLYNQFPDKINIPVNIDGSKIYFMLSVSTNNMQSRIENARITVNMKDGTKEILPLLNPDNIDDWLNYQQTKSYAESGYIQKLDTKAHSNILTVDLGTVKQIESVDFECLSSEVLAGLLGITVVEGEYVEPLKVSEITFNKNTLTPDVTITASANVENNALSDVPVSIMIALYNKDGVLKELKTENYTINGGNAECNISYNSLKYEDGDYIKAFLWNGLKNMKSLTADKILSNN